MNSASTHLRFISDQDGAAVLDTVRGTLVRLNSTGAYVWQQLQQRQTVNHIANVLAEETGAEISLVEADVRSFLEKAREHHLFNVEEV